MYVPSNGSLHTNDVEDAGLEEWTLGRQGMLITSESLLFNNDSKASVCSWLIRVNHRSFSTDTVSQPSPDASSYGR